MKSNWILLAIAILLLAVVSAGFAKFGPSFSESGPLQGALRLSQVVLIGLALVVGLMAFLAIISAAVGIANPTQALGLPEGSVRALIAFSLLLIFVCIAAFLYSTVDSGQLKGAFTKVPEATYNDLKANFVVATESIEKSDGATLYSGQYFSKRTQEADDFAKLIFTTLATVFVSVVSFYFGSSATSAGVNAGARAGGGDPANTAPSGTSPGGGSLNGTPVAILEKNAADARAAAARATASAKDAAEIAATVVGEKKDQAAAHAAALQDEAAAANRNADQAEKAWAAAKRQPAPSRGSATDVRVVPAG